jgi:hypothetical protein
MKKFHVSISNLKKYQFKVETKKGDYVVAPPKYHALHRPTFSDLTVVPHEGQKLAHRRVTESRPVNMRCLLNRLLQLTLRAVSRVRERRNIRVPT